MRYGTPRRLDGGGAAFHPVEPSRQLMEIAGQIGVCIGHDAETRRH